MAVQHTDARPRHAPSTTMSMKHGVNAPNAPLKSSVTNLHRQATLHLDCRMRNSSRRKRKPQARSVRWVAEAVNELAGRCAGPQPGAKVPHGKLITSYARKLVMQWQ